MLWWTWQSDVFPEIASIIELKTADTNTPGWFQHRQTAAKNLLDKMTEAERVKLREEADKMAKNGLPEDIQQK